MKKQKLILAIAVLAIILVSLCSCNQSVHTATTEGEDFSTTEISNRTSEEKKDPETNDKIKLDYDLLYNFESMDPIIDFINNIKAKDLFLNLSQNINASQIVREIYEIKHQSTVWREADGCYVSYLICEDSLTLRTMFIQVYTTEEGVITPDSAVIIFRACPHNTLYNFDDTTMMINGVYRGNCVESLLEEMAFFLNIHYVVILENGKEVSEGELRQGMIVQVYHDGKLYAEYTIAELLEPSPTILF